MLTILAATGLEAKAVRRAVAGVRVVEGGVALSRLRHAVPDGTVVTCGIAGALRTGLPTGTVVVPDRVLRPDGEWLRCDAALVDAFVDAARQLGMEPERGALATTPALVCGAARAQWARRGCVAADMETGLLHASRVAAVRVILDTPDHEISEAWRWPVVAMLLPCLWGQAIWLSREAPRCAARAAAVVAAALPEERRRPSAG